MHESNGSLVVAVKAERKQELQILHYNQKNIEISIKTLPIFFNYLTAHYTIK